MLAMLGAQAALREFDRWWGQPPPEARARHQRRIAQLAAEDATGVSAEVALACAASRAPELLARARQQGAAFAAAYQALAALDDAAFVHELRQLAAGDDPSVVGLSTALAA